MKAKTQYDDYIGTVAADISDHTDLNLFLSEKCVGVKNYEPIGIRFFSSNIGGYSFSVICKDKVKSDDNKDYIVQLDFKNKINLMNFISLFKRFEILLVENTLKSEKYEVVERILIKNI